MSLNGLDDAKVVEAYEGATSEPGGWFLLAYEGRDAVRVLSRGNGGISEVRNAVAEYEETSPLYGFLKYRRRSVVIKYLPDNCSRIIQGVCACWIIENHTQGKRRHVFGLERRPVRHVAEAELKLTSPFMRNIARVAVHFNAVCERFSPYDTMFEITSASELKDSKLSAACSLHTASCSTSSSSSSSRRRRLVEIAEEEEDDQRATKRQSTHDADESRSQTACDRPPTAEPVSLNSDLASSPEQSKFAAATTSDVPLFVGVNERRTSLDSDTHTIGSYPYSKPRVKLGPRPSADTNGRPHTAGNFRPVSVIPAGFKIFGKSGKRGKGKDGSSLSPPQEGTGGLDFSTSDGAQDRPTTSSSSIFDSVSVPVPTPAQKKPIITPEKARLMKAMQLREKNKKSNVLPSSGDPMGDDELNNADDDLTQVSDEAIVTSEFDYDKMTKDDSGVALEPPELLSHPDHTSDHATSDSRPASPLVDSSEADHDLSTKASSISESTDETIHASKEEGELNDVRDTETPTEDASHGNSLGDESNVAGESVAGTAEIVAEGTKDPITTTAELSTTSNIAEDAREGSTDHGESLGSVTLPVSRFSGSAATGPDEGNGGSSDTIDASKKLERVDSKDSSSALPGLKPKISVQDLWAATKAASQPTVTPPPLATVDADAVEDGNTRSSTEEAGLSSVSTEGTRRRSKVEPIKTTGLEQKKEEALDGAQSTSLELSSPVVLSKTPTTPGFPFPGTIKVQDGGNSGATSPHGLRTVSNPVRGKLVVPSGVHPTPVRSMSSGPSSIQQASQQHLGANLVKKSNNIGSSISQRIKALEKLSAATGGEIPTVPVRDRPASTFFSVKKKEVARPPFALDRANSFRTQTPPSPEQSQEASPEEGRLSRLERSGSVTSRLSMFEYPTSSTALGPRLLSVPGSGNSNSKARPESVCVMAKIVRDTGHTGSSSPEPPRDSYEYEHLDLKHSSLVVDQQPAPTAKVDEDAEVEQSLPTQDRENEADEESKPVKSRPSLSIVKDFIKERRKSATPDAGNSPSSPGRAESVHGANSGVSPRMTSSSSSHSSPSKDRDATTSPTESVFGDDGKSTNGDKKLSRAGRFMRRLSNISGARSKNSPPPVSTASKQEEAQDTAQSRPSTTGTPTIVSYMGDVNVQFPDNLLWKRRNMSLDSQGYLILSALPVQNGRPAPGTKRYHLGEFRTPYIPDVEVQELPNSVVLDFIEGSGVQVACEDRAGQLKVLQTLQEAHATRSTTYGL
ncbi:hypothetical protein E4U17_000616 [Claviceps sp. LM77 group G4]|nr:hypothetical protein E4U17_000616 [Claviceps sp. LM77 group G4]KAG6078776.1 hypothetical protein E4U33_000593 [Claviceps sp. LM78 group G4]KAG6078826.1 hypothetical protein E4U16_001405 [Claviceps sp. LM84 group G4]